MHAQVICPGQEHVHTPGSELEYYFDNISQEQMVVPDRDPGRALTEGGSFVFQNRQFLNYTCQQLYQKI